MKHPTRSVTFRCDLDQYSRLLEVAKRYDMTTTDVISFLLDCGLDVEKNYRPVFKATAKFCDLLDDLQQSDKGECIA